MGGEVHAQSPAGQETRTRDRRGRAQGNQLELVCICAECKKVIKIVGEGTSDSNPVVSHGICPECAQRLYGGLFRKRTDR